MTTTFYQYDSMRVFTGHTWEPGPKDLIPSNWTHIAPPDEEGFHIFDGVKWFTRAEYPTPPPAPEPPRHITVGQLFDRFGEHKWTILASDNALAKALIQDVSVRSFVDLDRPDLRQGLELLVLEGFAIDVDAILSSD